MLLSTPAPAPGIADLRARRAGDAVVALGTFSMQNARVPESSPRLSFKATSEAKQLRFCPCKLPFSLLALAHCMLALAVLATSILAPGRSSRQRSK